MSNRLANETSPYLQQHSENPVDWYPWCEEAFERAKSEDKPVFLSIGYSTCHWCHIMAHESFEDKQTAELLNRYFISIKVDREERPDIDSVYMAVCQALTGSGGWPTSIIMTPDKKAFFAGTDFPLAEKFGIPGFKSVLLSIAEQWNNNRSALLRSADKIIEAITQSSDFIDNNTDDNLIEQAVKMYSCIYDNRYGGFGDAPKFPTPHNLIFLLAYGKVYNRQDVLEMAVNTLTQMSRGGIFDHIGGGFSRYSTDRYFLVPHFEKMLYDNALLIIAYVTAYSITKENSFLDTAVKSSDYVLREMTSHEGGFYSAQDADSEGVEGKYYTFSKKEILNILGNEKGLTFCDAFDITECGNFEGKNIPNLLNSKATDKDFSVEIDLIYNYRKSRYALHTDDKILLSWNAMIISALCILYRTTQNTQYLSAAEKAQTCIENHLCCDLKLYTSYRNGQHSKTGVLDDYAYYIASLIELYHSTLNVEYLNRAEALCDYAVKHFHDNQNGGFFLSDISSSELFMNPKEYYDGAMPSGNSLMSYNLVRLFQITNNHQYMEYAKNQLKTVSAQASRYPAGFGMFLLSQLLYDNPPTHITITLKSMSDLKEVKSKLPFYVNILISEKVAEYQLINNRTTFYVCKSHMCFPPTNELTVEIF